MPWAPAKKEFQEPFKPAQAVQVQEPKKEVPVVDHEVETVKMPPEVVAQAEPAISPYSDSLLDIPKWQASAFTFDGDYNATALTSRRLEELLALAYLKSVRRTVVSTGLSYLASFSGRHRSGKSVTACTWAHLWDHTFWNYFETRVVQSPQDFVRAMEIVIKDNTKGAAFVVDEAGATMASSDWYEKWIRALQKTLQICGMLKPMILFVAPSRDFIVSGMRKLIVAEHYLERHHTDYTTIKAYHVKYSSIKHDYYYKKPMVKIADTTYQLNRIHQHAPPEWFLERYKNHTEPKKVDMMTAFSDVVKASVAEKDQDTEPDYEGLIEDVFQKKDIFFSRTSKDGYMRIDQAALEIHYKLRPKFAKYIKDRVERRIRESVDENNEKEAIQEGKLERMREAQEGRQTRDRLAALRGMTASRDDDVMRQTGVDTMKEVRDRKKQEEKEKLEKMDEELKDVLSSLS